MRFGQLAKRTTGLCGTAGASSFCETNCSIAAAVDVAAEEPTRITFSGAGVSCLSCGFGVYETERVREAHDAELAGYTVAECWAQ